MMREGTEPIKLPAFMSEKKNLQMFADQFCLTMRETEILEKLVTTEDGVREIADALYISRRSLQRHIASIYEKTGTKSRIGLFQTYMEMIVEEIYNKMAQV
ncbi:MAG: LuxR C-terminal-related transcriptional regulator [Lachnospiraceae bacterium]